MHKIVAIPESVSVQLTGQERPFAFSFAEFLRGRLNDGMWGRGLEVLETRAEIVKAFADKKPGDEVSLRRSDWELLAACTRNPTPPYHSEAIGQAMSFLYAIVNARDEA